MDPKEILLAALEAFWDEDFDQCAERLGDYIVWRLRGGFEPCRGDAFAAEIERSLHLASIRALNKDRPDYADVHKDS